ncbi:Ras-related protein Rab-20 [Geodia barretti]|uniref:Ras-related protein Rab-20 n=1 Tax=Geodia barretti TaxID=519541 RepID=A0AA35RT13_GEOBA|nr:Ras-related protein Rab-20 [Geodia barretti]
MQSIGASLALKRWGDWNVALWDTAGEERYASLSSFYCRGAAVAILVVDLTEAASVTRLREVFIPLLHDSVDSCLTVVVGTKLDLASGTDREVKTSVGRALAEDEHRKQVERALMRDANSYLQSVPTEKLYYETSAKTGEGVAEVFEFIQGTLLEEMERRRSGGGGRGKGAGGMDRAIRVGEGGPTKNKSCCDK